MTPRYKTVPDHWKAPEGPYRQAPEEYGGEWWLVNPFASTSPWITQSKPPATAELPQGFLEIFGPRPQASNYRGRGGHAAFQIAVADWERDLKYFKGAGIPGGFSGKQMEDAARVFEFWGLGAPKVYEGRYGWRARYPESQIPEFESGVRSAFETTHLVVAKYQLALLERGIVPNVRHPFVPPHVWPQQTETAE